MQAVKETGLYRSKNKDSNNSLIIEHIRTIHTVVYGNNDSYNSESGICCTVEAFCIIMSL